MTIATVCQGSAESHRLGLQLRWFRNLPKLDGDKLTFDVDVLESNLNGADCFMVMDTFPLVMGQVSEFQSNLESSILPLRAVRALMKFE